MEAFLPHYITNLYMWGAESVDIQGPKFPAEEWI